MLNTVIARVYPRIAVILVVMVPGLINSSATSMLISKKLWQNFGLDFDWLLFYLCLGTIIVHIRTRSRHEGYPGTHKYRGYGSNFRNLGYRYVPDIARKV